MLWVAAEQAVHPQQQLQGAEHRPARHFGHWFERHREPAARLTPGRMQQPQLGAVEQDADRVLGFLEQPLKALLGRGIPAMARGVPGFIKGQAPGALLGEIQHQGLQAFAFELRHAVGGAQGFAVFGQHHFGHGATCFGSQLVGAQ